ncbi:probable myosin light chain kinase DDB_G0279831 isoform X2 [Hydra vulgaris]|nr:probable myosin light chain kinase DDB_G0279831 isoform X2 [Hydra vulgaris]XP_047145686.1 probable myosin light chain kinase DDB_G0279831 isoform X2 [Hydra vulgaris]
MHCFKDRLYYEHNDTNSSDESDEDLILEKSKCIMKSPPFGDLTKKKLPANKSELLLKNFENQSCSNSLRKNFERKLSQSSHNLFETPRNCTQDDYTCKTLTPVMNRKNKRISFFNCSKENTASHETSPNLSRSSPRTNRKSIDITSSKEYKEIYASNVRLYSVVIAKQMASLGQVGREMNDLRRSKTKKKALNGNENFNDIKIQSKPKSNNGNHDSILNSRSNTNDHALFSNMSPLNESSLKNNIKFVKSKTELNDILVSEENLKKSSNEIHVSQTSHNHFGNNKSKNALQPSTTIIQPLTTIIEPSTTNLESKESLQSSSTKVLQSSTTAIQSSNTNLENKNNRNCGDRCHCAGSFYLGKAGQISSYNQESTISTSETSIFKYAVDGTECLRKSATDGTETLRKSAAERTECLRKCLESFDSTILMANTFLAKVKTQTTPDGVKP